MHIKNLFSERQKKKISYIFSKAHTRLPWTRWCHQFSCGEVIEFIFSSLKSKAYVFKFLGSFIYEITEFLNSLERISFLWLGMECSLSKIFRIVHSIKSFILVKSRGVSLMQAQLSSSLNSYFFLFQTLWTWTGRNTISPSWKTSTDWKHKIHLNSFVKQLHRLQLSLPDFNFFSH